jgi:hypothetical protein
MEKANYTRELITPQTTWPLIPAWESALGRARSGERGMLAFSRHRAMISQRLIIVGNQVTVNGKNVMIASTMRAQTTKGMLPLKIWPTVVLSPATA